MIEMGATEIISTKNLTSSNRTLAVTSLTLSHALSLFSRHRPEPPRHRLADSPVVRDFEVY